MRRDANAAVLVVRNRFIVVRDRDHFGVVRSDRCRIRQFVVLHGSWFFTTAGWMQLVLSGPAMRIGWLSAATQFAGTILFNISTGSALWAHAVKPERRLVRAPDATGSLAFLISGVLGVVAVTAAVGIIELKSRDWQSEWINLLGWVAFAVSALGAFISETGVTADAVLTNVGTFIGALCFLVAALVILPRRSHRE